MRFGESEKPNCHNCNCHKLGLDYLLSFLYQATKCQTKFVVNSEGIAFEVEASTNLQFLEVQSKASVITSCDRNVQTVKDVRIALASRWRNSLGKDETIIIAEFLTFHVAA